MINKMNLKDIRKEIDKIDEDMSNLFIKRMELAANVAAYKKENGLVISNPAREKEVLEKVTALTGEPLDRYGRVVFNTLFDVSRSYQRSCISGDSELKTRIAKSLGNTPTLFPEKAVVACQGIEGSYSQKAVEKLFDFPSIMYFNSFEGVFNAVEKGLCRYGILPIENSSYGSVGRVYDLMKDHDFYIAREAKLKVTHKLLAKQGTNLSNIREIISHEQALGQCSEFIKTLSDKQDIKITICENTALAAEAVSKSDRNNIGAISSLECAQLYGLKVLEENIQLSDHNYTRFICISRELEIYPGADKISLMLSLAHKPMSLYSMIAKFSSLGLNLTKLESRPIPGSDFEFMFYFDVEASVHREGVLDLLAELDQDPETFVFLGNYTEI